MKNYIVSFTDATGSHKASIKADNIENAIIYVVNWLAWGQAIIYHVDEVTELENGYKCYTSVFSK